MNDIRSYIFRLRDARLWLNNGRCCGQKVDGKCPDTGCILTEACDEFRNAANVISALSGVKI